MIFTENLSPIKLFPIIITHSINQMLDSFISRNQSVMMRIPYAQPYLGGPKFEPTIDKEKQKMMEENPFCLYMKRQDVITLEDLKNPPPITERKQKISLNPAKEDGKNEKANLSKLLLKKKPKNINTQRSAVEISIGGSDSNPEDQSEIKRENASLIDILKNVDRQDSYEESRQNNFSKLDISQIQSQSKDMGQTSKTPKSNVKAFFSKFGNKKRN